MTGLCKYHVSKMAALIPGYVERRFNHRELKVCRCGRETARPDKSESMEMQIYLYGSNLRQNFRPKHADMSHFLTKTTLTFVLAELVSRCII